ncbi:SpaA isopeptide-forming pilin-related protein [Streptomyces sp. NPDC059002]|uniref:SpaA isopeptide-forming pilin-related protein n=1 Tax=Streptomyces sp. NPDC059002 TaxID=3346690 RepID=UPI0036866FC9
MRSRIPTPSRIAAVAVAAGVVGTLAWAPSATAADKYGPGFEVPDSEGHAAASHIGAYGPPGLRVWGDYETYCADPSRRGPDAAGGYFGPRPVSRWASSETGQQVPAANLAYASYIIGKYGQTRSDSQAAAVDAATYDLLAGGAYGIHGARGKARLNYPNVSANSRTLALGYLAEAKKLAGPYELHVRPNAKETTEGTKVTVDVDVTSKLSGERVPGVKVALDSSSAQGSVTTGKDGRASWTFTASKAGASRIKGTATGLPGSQLKALDPHDKRAQRMLLAGDKTTVRDSAAVTVKPATGGLKIHKKDPEGSRLAGVTFQLRDSSGKVVKEGKTNKGGVLTFEGLAAGKYRLHETSTGDDLHELVADQDVLIVAGQSGSAKPITVIDPFKDAELVLKKVDTATGKPLANAVIEIDADDVDASRKHKPGKKVTDLTTGKDGLAKVKLGVDVKAGNAYWAKEIKAPAHYQLNGTPKRFTAKPGAVVNLTLTNDPIPATMRVLKTDKDTGKVLGGMGFDVSTVKVDPSGKKVPGTKVASGVTGADGNSAPIKLDATVDSGIEYLLSETKAPQGYDKLAKPVSFTARADSEVIVRAQDSKTSVPPTPTPSPSKPGSTPPPKTVGGGTPPETPSSGSLAKTGAEMAPWVLSGAAALLVAGGGTVWFTRRRQQAPANTGNSPQE